MYSSNKVLCTLCLLTDDPTKTSHTGDMLPANAGRDASRFIHDSTFYVTTTHINHTIHVCAAAAVRAAAKAMRNYALTRAINHGHGLLLTP